MYIGLTADEERQFYTTQVLKDSVRTPNGMNTILYKAYQ